MGLKSPTNLTSISLTLVLILPTKFLIRARTIFVEICYACIVNHRFLLTILPQVMYPNWYRNWKQRIVLDMIECLLNCYKKIISSLSPTLSLFTNQSLFTGICPDSLKIAKILPIFKKGDPSYLGNYRPLSLLPAISQVFEKVVSFNYMNTLTRIICCIKVCMGFVLTFPLSLPVLNLLTKYCTI